MLWTLRITTLAALALLISACSSVPVTGRPQLVMVTDTTVKEASVKGLATVLNTQRYKIGILSGAESTAAQQAVTMVNRVSNKIIDAAGMRDKRPWRIYVLNSYVQNAFVTPDGRIVVCWGILRYTETEAGLAALIAHDMAHLAAQHYEEHMSGALLAKLPFGVLQLFAGPVSSRSPFHWNNLYSGTGYGLLEAYTRQHESEADRLGQIYMAKAGYNPIEAAIVWRNLGLLSDAPVDSFTHVHPRSAERFTELVAWLPDASIYYTHPDRPIPTRLFDVLIGMNAHQSDRPADPGQP